MSHTGIKKPHRKKDYGFFPVAEVTAPVPGKDGHVPAGHMIFTTQKKSLRDTIKKPHRKKDYGFFSHGGGDGFFLPLRDHFFSFIIPPGPEGDPHTCLWVVAIPETKAVASATGKKP